eukprot:5451933-Amphidinium_carterae.1
MSGHGALKFSKHCKTGHFGTKQGIETAEVPKTRQNKAFWTLKFPKLAKRGIWNWKEIFLM